MSANESSSIGRRAALKGAAAAGAAVVVWAEPSIKGLARRPAYADTTSGAPIVLTNLVITGTINADGTITGILVDGATQPATGGTPIGNQSFEFVSDPQTNMRPRLRLINPSGNNGLLSITAATYDSGPGGPQAPDFFISASTRRLRFARQNGPTGENGMPGPFQVTVTIQCG